MIEFGWRVIETLLILWVAGNLYAAAYLLVWNLQKEDDERLD